MENTNNNVVLMDSKTQNKVILRSLALQGCFNYERMQAIGYCYAMIPALVKLYPDPQDMSEALERHVGFFNTSPQLVTFILGASIAMEEQYSKDPEQGTESITALKAALMGPLAGIGDSFFWGTFRIIGAALGTSLAVQGSILGAILFLVIYNVPHYILRFKGMSIGYTNGMSFLQKASQEGTIGKLTTAAKILGTTVVGAMIATMVKVSTPLVLDINGVVTEIQAIFDGILPQLLPLLLTFGVYALVKKGVKTTTLMFGLIIFGVIAVLIGVM